MTMLTKDKELIILAQNGNEEAKETLVDNYKSMIFKIANKYKTRDKEDIVQVAFLSFLKALKRYDVESDASFGTFAHKSINGELINYFRDTANIVSRKRTSNSLLKKINKFKEDFYLTNGFIPTVFEISEALALPVDEINYVIQESQPITYLSEKVNNDDNKEMELLDLVVDNHSSNNYEGVLLEDSLFTNLNFQQIQICKMFSEGLRKKEVAELFGFTESKMRNEINKIKKLLADKKNTILS